jgi:KaiC/GvpD/RAD55 family RecA-like ATPase
MTRDHAPHGPVPDAGKPKPGPSNRNEEANMYRREIGERNPLRIFERSIHGGLGRGNLGLVLSRPGGGKTGFLISVAIDDCLRERNVLHVSTRDSAEKARAFYEEVFHDLAESAGMTDRADRLRRLERHRRIHSFLGGTFTLAKLEVALDYMTRYTDFNPSAIIMDGFPEWEHASEDELGALKSMATRYDCEVWLTGALHRDGQKQDARGVPVEMARFDDILSVVVRLDPEADHVRVRLLKDHANPDIADLHLELDPVTFQVRWQ